MSNRNFTLIDFFNVLIKWRKTLFGLCFGVGVMALAFTFIMPYWYTSKTTILPPADDDSGFGLSSLLSNIPLGGIGASLGLGGLSEDANLFIAITNSRVMFESVVKKFNLQTAYEVKTLQEAVEAASKHLSLDINEEGTITLRFEYSTGYFPTRNKKRFASERAYEIVSFIMQEFQRLNAELKTKKAQETRIFIEKRYRQNIADLAIAEERFRDFQKKYGAVALEEQMIALIQTAAQMKAQLISEEVQLDLLKRQFDVSHPQVVEQQLKVDALKKAYSSINKKENAVLEKKNNDIFVSLGNMPDIGLEYFRLYRELTLQEKIMEFILPQYEQAKIQEAKDAPAVQIIDPPNIPELKSRPKRAVVILVTILFVGMMAVLFVTVYERILLLKEDQPEVYEKIVIMTRALGRDFRITKKSTDIAD